MQTVNVQDIIDDVRNVYLNDQAGRFTNAILMPYIKMALGYMETNLEENGVACKNEIDSAIPVKANATELTPLPADFIMPIALKERAAGSSDLYTDMHQRPWEPEITPGDKLVYWTWRHDRIMLAPATTDREVKLYYQRTFPIANVTTDVVYGYARQFLSAKTAALVHMLVSQNETLASVCDNQANLNMEQIINIQIKKLQAMPYRRRPYTPFR
jgi:hypothetical protein